MNNAAFTIHAPDGQRVQLTWLDAVCCRVGLLESLCAIPEHDRQGDVPFEIPERGHTLALVDELTKGIDTLQGMFSMTELLEGAAA